MHSGWRKAEAVLMGMRCCETEAADKQSGAGGCLALSIHMLVYIRGRAYLDKLQSMKLAYPTQGLQED